MIIKVPKDVEQEFLSLLELSLCSLENDGHEQFNKFTKKEKKCLKFVKEMIKNPQ